MHPPFLIVGGAPRVPIDALRYMSVPASGQTALRLRDLLVERGQSVELLLSVDAARTDDAQRFSDRATLDRALLAWIAENPEGGVLLSAAVNDYQVERIHCASGGLRQDIPPRSKIPSGAEALEIRLRPTPKLIDCLRPKGLRGPLVGFKYEDASSVVTSAGRLLKRSGADLVLANSLCGQVQALVDAKGVQQFAGREAVLSALADRLAAW